VDAGQAAVARGDLSGGSCRGERLLTGGGWLRSVGRPNERQQQRDSPEDRALLTTFGAAHPFLPQDTSAGRSTARELLDRGVARLDTALAVSRIFGRAGAPRWDGVYVSLGLYDQAGAQLQLAMAEQRALTGDRHMATAAVLDELGQLRAQQGRLEEADSLLAAALGTRRALLGSRDSNTAATMEHLAKVRRDRDQQAAAESLGKEALAVRRAIHGDTALSTAASEHLLAEC